MEDNKDIKEKTKKSVKLKAWLSGLGAKKLTVLIVLVIFVLATIGGVVATAVILNKDNEFTPAALKYYSIYYYGIGTSDTTGIQLKYDWMGDLGFNDFEVIKSDEAIELSDKMVLTSANIKENAEFEISFIYNGIIITRYKINVLKGAVYLRSPSDLKAMDTSTSKYYIQTSNILINDTIKLRDFQGTFFGNYFNLTALNIGTGGLFNKISDSQVFSLRLIDVSGNITLKADNSYVGAIANYASRTSFYDCSAKGEFSVTLQGSVLNKSHIGGLFGYFGGNNRTSNAQDWGMYEDDWSVLNFQDGFTSVAANCTSEINLTVNGNGSSYIGGIAGTVYNPSLRYCQNNGKIDIKIDTFTFLYVGGIAAVIEKYYEPFGYRITGYDYSLSLKNRGEINIETTNSDESALIYAAGLVAKLINHNFYGGESLANINIHSDGAAMFTAGLVARAINELNSSNFHMYIRDCLTNADLTVKTSGNLAIAKLVCEGVYIVFEDNDFIRQYLNYEMDNQKMLIYGEETAINQ